MNQLKTVCRQKLPKNNKFEQNTNIAYWFDVLNTYNTETYGRFFKNKIYDCQNENTRKMINISFNNFKKTAEL